MIAFLRELTTMMRRQPSALTVRVSDKYVALLEGDRQCAQVIWSEVREVVTFKRDFGTYDDICLALRVDDRWVEISEDAEGWSALCSALDRHFLTIPPGWCETVMLPPFVTCYRVLFERT
jgi:hypothetical protein